MLEHIHSTLTLKQLVTFILELVYGMVWEMTQGHHMIAVDRRLVLINNQSGRFKAGALNPQLVYKDLTKRIAHRAIRF